MIKYIFCAVVASLFLAGTTTAADGDTCSLQCNSLNGTANYTGDTSVVVEIGTDTDILFDVNYKIFSVISIKYNLAFATNGRFLIILNIKTGVYILIDIKTLYAVTGTIDITFLSSSNVVNYSEFIIRINTIFTKYTTITTETSGQFNFNLILVAFYSSQFDLTVIFASQQELATLLQTNFSGWFSLVQTQIRSGALSISSSYWGFLAVIISVNKIRTSLTILEVIRISVTYYETIEIDLITQLVNTLRINITQVQTFATKLSALIRIFGRINITTLISYLNNSQYNAATYQLTVAGVRYTIIVYRIKASYIIRFSLVVNNVNIDYELVYVNGVLFIVNMRTNIVLALQGRSLLIVNRTEQATSTSNVIFVASSSGIISTKVSVYQNSTFIATLTNEQWLEASAQVLVYIKQNSSSGRSVNLQTLIQAVVHSNVKKVAKLIGSTELAGAFVTSFRGYLVVVSANNGFGRVSLSGFLIGIFGAHVRYNIIVRAIIQVLSTVSSTGLKISTFLESFLKIVVSAKGSYSYSTG